MKQSEKAMFEKIRTHLDNDSIADRFLDLIERSEDVDLGALVEEVDASNYSLLDWAEALLGFDEWLTNQQKSARGFSGMLGYIHCCQMMASETVNLPKLQSIVHQCLEEYGFDQSQPSQK